MPPTADRPHGNHAAATQPATPATQAATAPAQPGGGAGWCKWCGMSLCLVRHPRHGFCSSHCYGLATGAA